MDELTFYLFGYIIKLNVNLFELYACATAILLYISASLIWMFRDLFRGKDVIYLNERIPKAGKNALIWKCLFALCIISGFFICTYYFAHERAVMALLIPIPIFALARSFSSANSYAQKTSHRGAEIAILVLLIFGAAVVRFYDVSNYPPGLDLDEIHLARDATRMSMGKVAALSWASWGPPLVCSAPDALFQQFLPRCRVAVRFYSILCGIICIPAFYCLARRCLPTVYARLAAILLIFSPYHIFYSRATLGSRMIILEILFIYFVITGINKRSFLRVAFAAIGAGILQYDYIGHAYCGPIILLVGIFIAWVGRRIKVTRTLLYFAIVIAVILGVLAPLLFAYIDIYPRYTWWFLPGSNPRDATITSFDGLKQAIPYSFLMFKDKKYGYSRMGSQALSTCLNFPLLALLFTGLLLSFTIFYIWPAYFIGLCFLFALSPSWFSSIRGNSHRAMLVIPLMYLLIGYSLWTLTKVLKSFIGRFISYWLLGIIVIWSSIWGLKYSFQDNMWRDHCENLCTTSAIRLTEAAWELYKKGYQIFTSRHSSQFWIYLYNDPEKLNINEIWEDVTFQPKDWLPENWNCKNRAIVLSEQKDSLIFNIMTRWAWLYSWEEKFYPIGGARLLIGKFDGYKKKMLAPKPTLYSLDGEKFGQWDGSLMFAKQYELVLKDQTEGAEIYIDGEPWFSDGEKAVFAAGLHDVQILLPIVKEDETCIWEPFFNFEIRDIIEDVTRKVRVTPSMLYTIPVRGWVHKAYPADDPSKTMYFEIVPFISGNFGCVSYPRGKRIINEWKSKVCQKRGETLIVSWAGRGSDVEVYINGKACPRAPGRNRIDLQLKGSEEEQVVLIRVNKTDHRGVFLLKRNKKECAPYEVFCPIATDRFRSEREEEEKPPIEDSKEEPPAEEPEEKPPTEGHKEEPAPDENPEK